MATPIRQGDKPIGTMGEVWYLWILFPRLTDEQAAQAAREWFADEHIGAPGTGFTDRPTIRHSLSYTLIQQRNGIDV